jgi:hypothetical protein
VTRARRSLWDRFWEKVDRSGGDDSHWLWLGAVDGNGYGKIRHGETFVIAHRCALGWATGNDGLGFDAAHDDSKGCPRRCVNPRHLSWKTHRENMLDVLTKHGRLGGNRKIALRPLPLLENSQL